MKTLVISDIHGNLPALEAVATVPHDDVICLGDIVGYGPWPGACLAWVRAHASLVVQGNHDCSAADGSPPRCRPEFETLAKAVATATATRLSQADRDYLRDLPRWSSFQQLRRRILCLHATPRDPRYQYLANDAAGWAHELTGVGADLLLVGHTHLPFVLDINGQCVVNPGSVGQPKDGDPRAAYAILEDGEATLQRIAYSVDRTIEGLGGLALADDVMTPLAQLLRTGDPAVVRGPPAAIIGRGMADLAATPGSSGARPQLARTCDPLLPSCSSTTESDRNET